MTRVLKAPQTILYVRKVLVEPQRRRLGKDSGLVLFRAHEVQDLSFALHGVAQGGM